MWNIRVFRLFVLGIFFAGALRNWYRLEQAPKPENGDQPAVALFPCSSQKEDEHRWKTSKLTAYWPDAHWDTHTWITEEAKPQVCGDTPWNTVSPGFTDTPLSHTIPASSATPIPPRLHRAWRHTSSRASFSGKQSRMATRRGTTPWRSSSSCCLTEAKSWKRMIDLNCFSKWLKTHFPSTHSCHKTFLRWPLQREKAVLGQCWSALTEGLWSTLRHWILFEPQLKHKQTKSVIPFWPQSSKQKVTMSNQWKNLRSLASSATSFAVSTVMGPLFLRDRARMGRIPLITTCSAVPFPGHKWKHLQLFQQI